MSKITFSAIALFSMFGGSVLAQSAGTLQTRERFVVGTDAEQTVQKNNQAQANSAESVIWQEDFANGVPATWTSTGFDGSGNNQAACRWEYRGPNTTPDNTVGSRGAYWSGGGLPSPTASNGFMIFDSDYLDNAGVAGNFGNGTAPGPNVAILTTNTINLTGEPFVQLSMYSRFRSLGANSTYRKSKVAISIDGGVSWPDTILIHPNAASNSTVEGTETINLSSIAGGQANVKLRFIFDALSPISLVGGLTAYGYYFWEIDDIKIESLPKHELKFTTFNGAPEQDIIYGPQNSPNANGLVSARHGHMSITNTADQTRDIEFDCNVVNYGFGTLNNVHLTVDILDANDVLITSYTSASDTDLVSGETADYNVLNTYGNPWNPNAIGEYKLVYKAIADSAMAVSDTFRVSVTGDQLSLDNSVFSNSFGSDFLGEDGSALAQRIDLVQNDVMGGVWIGLSSLTVHGAVLEVVVADTLGFDFTVAGFPSTSLKGQQTDPNGYTITADDVANGFCFIPVTDGANPHIALNAGAYYVAVYMYSNSGNNLVRIRNDQSFASASWSRWMYDVDDARWYSGYTAGNLTYNNMWIRSVMGNIGLEEDQLNAHVSVSPNPATTVVNVEFTDIEGDFTVTMTDISGRVISVETVSVFGMARHSVNVAGLSSGVYMLNINNGKGSATHKISVQ